MRSSARHDRHPYPVRGRDNTRPGRPRRGKVAAFADRLLKRRADVLRCASEATVPPENNQAERDLRMARLAAKIAGGFRTATGAAAFCTIRSALSSAQTGWHGRRHTRRGVHLINGPPVSSQRLLSKMLRRPDRESGRRPAGHGSERRLF